MVIKLETQRLFLRKPKEEDWKEIFPLINDKIIFKNFFTPYPYEKKHTKNFVKYWIKDWGKNSYWMILELKKNKKIIGVAGIKKIDKISKTAYAHSWIGKDYRKKGYITEAKIKIFNFAFNNLKSRKINSEVASYNKESNEMQKKFGMVFEGKRRKDNYNPYLKKFVDMNLYGIFKNEWKKIEPKLEKDLRKRLK